MAFEQSAVVLKDSKCIYKPELQDACDIPSTDCTVCYEEWVPYYSTYGVADSNAPVEFRVPVEGSFYLDLKHSFISMRLRMSKGTGDVPSTELIAPDCGLFHLLWDDVHLYLNDTVIADSAGLYGHQAVLDRMLWWSPYSQESELQQEFFWENRTPDTFTDSDPGFKQRRDLTKGSKAFVIAGRPALGIFDQDRLIIPGSTIKLSMRRAPIEKVLVSSLTIADPSVYKLTIESATFWACRS